MAERKADKAVDAFSAPKALLRAAHQQAKARRMTKSGFYRYCIAKEIGHSEEEALHYAEHAGTAIFNVIEDEPTQCVAEEPATQTQAQTQSQSARKPIIYEKAKRKKKGDL